MAYHVLNRGNGRQQIFRKPTDYAAFLRCRARVSFGAESKLSVIAMEWDLGGIVRTATTLWMLILGLIAASPGAVSAEPDPLDQLLNRAIRTASMFESAEQSRIRVYDISPMLMEASSSQDAALRLGVSPELATYVEHQLLRNHQTWKLLPNTSRHRVMDYAMMLDQALDHAGTRRLLTGGDRELELAIEQLSTGVVSNAGFIVPPARGTIVEHKRLLMLAEGSFYFVEGSEAQRLYRPRLPQTPLPWPGASLLRLQAYSLSSKGNRALIIARQERAQYTTQQVAGVFMWSKGRFDRVAAPIYSYTCGQVLANGRIALGTADGRVIAQTPGGLWREEGRVKGRIARVFEAGDRLYALSAYGTLFLLDPVEPAKATLMDIGFSPVLDGITTGDGNLLVAGRSEYALVQRDEVKRGTLDGTGRESDPHTVTLVSRRNSVAIARWWPDVLEVLTFDGDVAQPRVTCRLPFVAERSSVPFACEMPGRTDLILAVSGEDNQAVFDNSGHLLSSFSLSEVLRDPDGLEIRKGLVPIPELVRVLEGQNGITTDFQTREHE